MLRMKHLSKDTLAIFMHLLCGKSLYNTIWLMPEHEGGKFILKPRIFDDLKIYGLENMLSIQQGIVGKISLKDKTQFLDFINKYIENFRNDKLEVGILSFLTFKQNIEWGYKILYDASIGNGDKITINTEYSELKESYPNIPENIRLLEFLLYLHLRNYAKIVDCEYLCNRGAKIKLILKYSVKEIIEKIKGDTNPVMKKYKMYSKNEKAGIKGYRKRGRSYA